MLSAFGVDHGEIAKVRTMRGFGGRRPTRAQKKVQNTGGPSGPRRVANKLKAATEADISLKGIGEGTGRGLKGVGGFLEKRPGLTGTALVGGGGAAGYGYLSRKEPKRR